MTAPDENAIIVDSPCGLYFDTASRNDYLELDTFNWRGYPIPKLIHISKGLPLNRILIVFPCVESECVVANAQVHIKVTVMNSDMSNVFHVIIGH